MSAIMLFANPFQNAIKGKLDISLGRDIPCFRTYDKIASDFVRLISIEHELQTHFSFPI